jgi:hypothetical protein
MQEQIAPVDYCSCELHDYCPDANYRRNLKILTITWVLLIIMTVLFSVLFMLGSLSLGLQIVFWLLISLDLVVPALLLLAIYFLRIVRLWDNMDYDGLTKVDYLFTTSDGLKHCAYLYHREGVNIHNDPKPRPTIIGIHGYMGYHRIMDRYCLPTVREARDEEYLFFSFDVRGHGKTPGDRNDLRQFYDAKEFINQVKNDPLVDKKRICMAGMSLGGSKVAVLGYKDPEIKLLILLSSTLDFKMTKENMRKGTKIMFKLLGFPLEASEQKFQEVNAFNHFHPDGVVLQGHSEPTPNSNRVFMACNLDDPLVPPENTLKAIEVLKLPPENYRIFKKGKHIFESNEWLLSAALFNFIHTRL